MKVDKALYFVQLYVRCSLKPKYKQGPGAHPTFEEVRRGLKLGSFVLFLFPKIIWY